MFGGRPDRRTGEAMTDAEQIRKDQQMSVCIYHGNCADGFGAAWVVRKALGNIEFFPGKYQEPPPDVRGKDVVMVDFSYKRPVLLEMAEKANSILLPTADILIVCPDLC